MKKNGFLAFIFSFIPGAGQMYLGYMKRGASLMLAFSAVTAISAFFNVTLLTVLLPVIWFYAFFDTFNLNGMTYEQRLYVEDKFLFRIDEILGKDWLTTVRQRHTFFGSILVLLGAFMLYNTLLREYLWEIAERYPLLAHLIDSIPTVIVAFAVIFLGIRLLAGGTRKTTPPDDGLVEYGRSKQND